MDAIIGAVFPISHAQAVKIFQEGKQAFAKYTKFGKLETNSKIIFYVSKEKKFVGEAVIDKIRCLSPEDAWSTYSNQLFLTQTEFEDYTSISPIGGKPRPRSELTVFLLKKVKKYRAGIPAKIKMTPSGSYLGIKDYNEIVKTKT